MQHTASFSTLNTSAGVQRRLVSRSASPAQQLRCGRQARIERRLVARAEVEQAAAAAATSSGEFSDSEDRVPPGCARYTVELPKPLGLVLEEGQGGRGVYVAEIAAEGNAARLAPEISVGDELIATSGMVYTTEQEYQGNRVRGGETYVRLNVRNNDFKTVMAAIGSIKPPRLVVLEFQRCQ
ncbi:hypothetical protein ABPG77_008568 [Micractinium sp. CCAP 211/92]